MKLTDSECVLVIWCVCVWSDVCVCSRTCHILSPKTHNLAAKRGHFWELRTCWHVLTTFWVWLNGCRGDLTWMYSCLSTGTDRHPSTPTVRLLTSLQFVPQVRAHQVFAARPAEARMIHFHVLNLPFGLKLDLREDEAVPRIERRRLICRSGAEADTFPPLTSRLLWITLSSTGHPPWSPFVYEC